MLFVLACNSLSAISYMVRITDVPNIDLAKKIVSNGEIVVYLMVPLSIPAQRVYNMVIDKVRKGSNDEDKRKCE